MSWSRLYLILVILVLLYGRDGADIVSWSRLYLMLVILVVGMALIL